MTGYLPLLDSLIDKREGSIDLKDRVEKEKKRPGKLPDGPLARPSY